MKRYVAPLYSGSNIYLLIFAVGTLHVGRPDVRSLLDVFVSICSFLQGPKLCLKLKTGKKSYMLTSVSSQSLSFSDHHLNVS